MPSMKIVMVSRVVVFLRWRFDCFVQDALISKNMFVGSVQLVGDHNSNDINVSHALWQKRFSSADNHVNLIHSSIIWDDERLLSASSAAWHRNRDVKRLLLEQSALRLSRWQLFANWFSLRYSNVWHVIPVTSVCSNVHLTSSCSDRERFHSRVISLLRYSQRWLADRRHASSDVQTSIMLAKRTFERRKTLSSSFCQVLTGSLTDACCEQGRKKFVLTFNHCTD